MAAGIVFRAATCARKELLAPVLMDDASRSGMSCWKNDSHSGKSMKYAGERVAGVVPNRFPCEKGSGIILTIASRDQDVKFP